MVRSCLVAGCFGIMVMPALATELKMSSPWFCPENNTTGCSRWYEVYEKENAAACECLSVTENCGRWYSVDHVFTPPRSERKNIRYDH